MTEADDTNRLIGALASDLGRPGLGIRPMLAVAAATGLGLALLASSAFLADRTRLADALHHGWLYQKLICMAALAAGAWPILDDLARPERSGPRYATLLPALLLLLAGAIWDPQGVGLSGQSVNSVPSCLADIVLLTLPGLALILIGLRRTAAPTRPALAGAAAGLLAGALAALAYAFACRNDGGLFILVWYGAAIAIVSGFGAAAGRLALAW